MFFTVKKLRSDSGPWLRFIIKRGAVTDPGVVSNKRRHSLGNTHLVDIFDQALFVFFVLTSDPASDDEESNMVPRF